MSPKRPHKSVDSSSSDSDIEDPSSTPMSKRRAIPAEPSWVGCLLDNQTKILKHLQSTSSSVQLKQILSCVVCKDLARNGVVPKCCHAIICCQPCLQRWLQNSSSCPSCRQNLLSISNDTTPFPKLVPLYALTQEL